MNEDEVKLLESEVNKKHQQQQQQQRQMKSNASAFASGPPSVNAQNGSNTSKCHFL